MQCIANCKYCFQMFLGLSVTDWTARSIFKACERIKDLVTANFYSYKTWEKVEPFNRAKVVTGWFLSRVENSVGGRTRMPAWHVWHPCGCAQASHPRATAVGTRLHLRPVETAFGEWSLFPFCCQPTPAAFLTNLQPAEIQQASWHKDFITSSLNLYFTGWISLLKNTSRSVKTSQSLSMSGQNRMIFLFSRQFSYTKQSWLHVFFNFPVVSEDYVSCLSYLTLVSRTQIALWQTLLSSSTYSTLLCSMHFVTGSSHIMEVMKALCW